MFRSAEFLLLFTAESEAQKHGQGNAIDPGCVKTPWCCYDSRVILAGGIDEALR
jgi:phosphoribosylanthranilate isomerase